MDARLNTSDTPKRDSKQNEKKFRSLIWSERNALWIVHRENEREADDGREGRISVDGCTHHVHSFLGGWGPRFRST